MLFNNVMDVVEIDNPFDQDEQMDLLRMTEGAEDRYRLLWKLVVIMGVPMTVENLAFFYPDIDVVSMIGETDIDLLMRPEIQTRILKIMERKDVLENNPGVAEDVLCFLIGVLEIPAMFILREIKVIPMTFVVGDAEVVKMSHGRALSLENARMKGTLPTTLEALGYALVDETAQVIEKSAVMPAFLEPRRV